MVYKGMQGEFSQGETFQPRTNYTMIYRMCMYNIIQCTPSETLSGIYSFDVILGAMMDFQSRIVTVSVTIGGGISLQGGLAAQRSDAGRDSSRRSCS